MPENIPKTLMDTMSKTINEKNPQDATMPAVSMTGPIFTIESITAWRFAEMLADANKAEVVLLHVFNSNTPANLVEQFTTQLSEIVAKSQLQVNTNIQIIIDDDVAKAIVREAQAFDLAVLRSVRYRTTGGLAVSQVTTQVIDELTGSIVLLGEAHL